MLLGLAEDLGEAFARTRRGRGRGRGRGEGRGRCRGRCRGRGRVRLEVRVLLADSTPQVRVGRPHHRLEAGVERVEPTLVRVRAGLAVGLGEGEGSRQGAVKVQ